MKEAARRRVSRIEGGPRADHAEVVGDVGQLGEELADFQAGFAVALEFKWRWIEAAGGALGAEIDRVGPLAGVFFEGRLGVKRIDLRGAAGQEEDDVGPGARGELRLGNHRW